MSSIILSTSFILAFNVSIVAANLSVCSSCTIQSIDDALSVAEPWDTITILAGEYIVDNLEIKIPLTIVGVNYPAIISKEGEEIFTVTSDCTYIKGLHFSGSRTSYLYENAAIRMKKVSHFDIESNRFTNNFFAVYLEHSAHGNISNNQITGGATQEISSGNAIHAWYCQELNLSGNQMSGHRDGIYFEFVSNSTISGNVSMNNLRYGLHFMFSNDNIYSHNQFIANAAGVAVMFSKNISMSGNIFERNWGSNAFGILLKEIYDSRIEHNKFIENTTGIIVENSSRVEYLNNDFHRNGWAVKIAGGCLENHFQKNNFVNNSFDFSVFSSFNDSSINGNYWSSYTGYDIDRDGVGDVAHRPMSLFSYMTQQCDESLILIRSLFVSILNAAEQAYPVFTPVFLKDEFPHMSPLYD